MVERAVPESITVTRQDGSVTVSRRTYRSGDFTHIIFSALATIMGLLVLWIAIDSGTVFDGIATPLVVGALLAYGYFGLTRITNRRTVTVDRGRIVAKDGPLPQFVRSLDAAIDEYGTVEVRSATRFTFPPISRYRLWYVGGQMSPDLFRRLPSEEEAECIRAIVSNAARSA
jgi:hypothetical protein